MWTYILVVGVFSCGAIVAGYTDKMISKGSWMVESVEKCPNAEQYLYDFNLRKRKLNRTHDGFSFVIDLPVEITEKDFGILVEACKKVDGGCKLVQVFDEDSFCDFLKKHAESNFKKVLVMANLEPNCPIPKGRHEVEDFTFNYDELPEQGMLGEFKGTIYLKKGGERLVCFIIGASFKIKEDNDMW